MGATTSSLQFYMDGAEASFEDCFWVNNLGSGNNGAVVDIHSTSEVKFFRCDISDIRNNMGGGFIGGGGYHHNGNGSPRVVGADGSGGNIPHGFQSTLTMHNN